MKHSKKIFKLAIDGPSGVGKSTTANELAEKLNFVRIDSGTLYGALTYILLKRYCSINDKIIIENVDEITKIYFLVNASSIIFENENIKDKLRSNEVDKNVSLVARHNFIREKIKQLQYSLIDDLEERGCLGIIIDGRDIGTVILPDADLKIFLTANAESRAKRRHRDFPDIGYDVIFEDMKRRDYEDIHREHGPLKKADDAIEVDNSSLKFDEQIDIILSLVKEKMEN